MENYLYLIVKTILRIHTQQYVPSTAKSKILWENFGNKVDNW